MSARLLAILDAALDAGETTRDPGGAAAQRRDTGFVAATSLNDMLIRHRLGWDDVVLPGSRLAKLCGRLGSAYIAEREAAYDHAVRLIRQRGTTWSALVRLPAGLRDGPTELDRAAERRGAQHYESQRHEAARPSPHNTAQHKPAPRNASQRTTEAEAPFVDQPYAVSAPDGDWITTVRALMKHAAWHSEADFALLEVLELRLAAGHAIRAGDARWLRDLWWHAELHHPGPG